MINIQRQMIGTRSGFSKMMIQSLNEMSKKGTKKQHAEKVLNQICNLINPANPQPPKVEKGNYDEALRILQSINATQAHKQTKSAKSENKPVQRSENESVPTLSPLQLSSTAHHEAGHAILATCFKLSIDEIHVGIKKYGGARGNVSGSYTLNNSEADIESWKNIALSAAGPMAAYAWRNGRESLFDFNASDIPIREGVASDDGFQIQMILESTNASDRDAVLDRGIKYARSRLIRNWHHLTNLATNLKENRTMNAEQFQSWFNKITRYDEFHY